jgi:hypothetical protein
MATHNRGYSAKLDALAGRRSFKPLWPGSVTVPLCPVIRTSDWENGTRPLTSEGTDLNPLDDFFLGYVKNTFYIPPLPRTIPELKERSYETSASVKVCLLR